VSGQAVQSVLVSTSKAWHCANQAHNQGTVGSPWGCRRQVRRSTHHIAATGLLHAARDLVGRPRAWAADVTLARVGIAADLEDVADAAVSIVNRNLGVTVVVGELRGGNGR